MKSSSYSPRSLALLMVLILALAGATAIATPLPPVLEAALIAQIFRNDLTIKALPPAAVQLLLLDDGQHNTALTHIEEALLPTRIPTRRLPPSELSGRIKAAAIYVPGTIALEALQTFCTANAVLSITSDTDLTESGHAAIGLGTSQQDRPEIVVHTRRLASEKHDLSPNLLKAARILGG